MADQIKREPPMRSFTIIYNDFIDSESILSSNEKLIYLILLRYGDNVFPSLSTLSRKSGLSKRTVQRTIDSLIEKKFISKKGRKNEKTGGYTSNLYFVFDNAELWQERTGDNEESVKDYGEDKLFNEIKSRPALLARIKKELISSAGQSNDTSPKKFNNHTEQHYNTDTQELQALERYSEDDIRELFDYDILIERKPNAEKDIELLMNVIYDAMNCTKPTMRVCGENKPTMVVISRLSKLYYEHLLYVLDKYGEQTGRIKNPAGYLLTMLYKSAEQMSFDVQNQVLHDFHENKSADPE